MGMRYHGRTRRGDMMKIRHALGFGLGLACVVAVASARPAFGADCAKLKKQLADLDDQLGAIQKVYEKDPTDAAVRNKMSGIIKSMQDLGDQIGRHCTQRTPAPKSVVAPTATGIPDPQIAVGEDYVLSLSTGSFAFYKRVGDGLAATPTTMSSDALFGGIQKKLNKHLVSLDSRLKDACDPDHPTQVPTDKDGNLSGPPACVTQFYDARAAYDGKRKKFWIV